MAQQPEAVPPPTSGDSANMAQIEWPVPPARLTPQSDPGMHKSGGAYFIDPKKPYNACPSQEVTAPTW